MKIKLYLDQTTTKTQGHPLRLAVYVSTKDRSYPFTSYYSTIEHWNFDNEEPKKSHPQYLAIMDFLFEKRRIILQIQNSREKLSAKQIVAKILGEEENAESIYTFWEERIKELRKMKKIGNAEFYESYLSAWKSYKSQILFSEIDYNFLTKFKIHKLQDISPNGVNVYLKAIQAIYNEAVRRRIFKPDSFVSPFSGIKEKEQATKDKYLTFDEMKIVGSKNIDHDYFRYFMLCFYLGGLDFVDIANLKKEHIKAGRIRFERFKGGTSENINNFIFPEAQEILEHFKDNKSDYLLPIHKYSYKNHRDAYTAGIRLILMGMGVNSYISSKTPRYSFIHIGNKHLFLNRDIIKELVGHAQSDTHSIYEGKFPDKIKDDVHRQIIDSIKTSE